MKSSSKKGYKANYRKDVLTVLHCPASVGGHAWELSRAERMKGIRSDVMSFKRHPFGYGVDISLGLERYPAPIQMLVLLRFMLSALRKYDIFHFNFGASLLSHFRFPFIPDLAFLGAAGKKIFITYQGCDARMKEFSRKNFSYSACHSGECRNAWCNSITDKVRLRRIRLFSKKARAIFCLNPDLCRFVPHGVFLPYANVDLKVWVPGDNPLPRRSEQIRILHAPSDRHIKGTSYVERAVRKIQSTNHQVVLDIAEGISHQQMRERMKKADIVIDQLLVGWYGGLAVEAMAQGKPVISYIRTEDLMFIPTEMARELPVVSANIKNIGDILIALIHDTERLKSLGHRGRAYVEKWHDPLKIAGTTIGYYHNAFAPERVI